MVPTSLIEAGVDVDFPAVFREEAGLDFILQSAGRCSWEGRRSPAEIVVTIFQSEAPPPPLFRRSIDAGQLALGQFDRPDCEEAVSCYFSTLLTLTGKEGQDEKRILPLMDDTRRPSAPWRSGSA